ncbi:MAG: hypothetical protein HKN29_12570 [Rhodothermales bacterium]|nr:hypothetical protein [Rhodothermales bacterium]
MLKTNPAFVEVLVASVIDRLQHGRAVRLPGIGTLSVDHEAALVSSEGDTPEVQPPGDRVRFKPESR